MNANPTSDSERPLDPNQVLADVWQLGGLPASALAYAVLTGRDPVFPSSFAVGTAAQTSIAGAALAACELGVVRGQARQTVQVNMAHAALECTGWFSLADKVPEVWDKFSGLYRCADGWVRIHTNFAHHRDGALRLMGLAPENCTRQAAEQAMLGRSAFEFEAAAAKAGLVVAALRDFDAWDQSAPGQAIAAQPLMTIEQIGPAAPLPLPALSAAQRPLTGVRVLDLTRILAGPVCGRTLSAHGAEVMLVNSPHLPNIAAIADTSRGKLSCHVDLRQADGQAALQKMLATSHVFVQGYRPGALAALGWDPQSLAKARPGIVCVSLSAYGEQGPWHARRGFDSLVQTAMGFNLAEAKAAASDTPQALPMQILDYATGHWMAFAVAVALARQQQIGGSWHVKLSLAQTGHWLRSLGRIRYEFALTKPDRTPFLETAASGFGKLTALKHSAVLARTPHYWAHPSMPPGAHAAQWPQA